MTTTGLSGRQVLVNFSTVFPDAKIFPGALLSEKAADPEMAQISGRAGSCAGKVSPASGISL
jgi:hypothetical protein